jgi:hypothetical protein
LANRVNADANLQLIKNKIDDELSKIIASTTQPERLRETYPLSTFKINKKLWVAICIASGLFAIGWIVFKTIAFERNHEKRELIRSTFTMPIESMLLKRMDIIQKIDKVLSLKTEEQEAKIHYAVLIGIGGSGKTTLASIYAQQYDGAIAYQMNAQSYETLKQSYLQLAYELAKTPEEKEHLTFIENIQNQQSFIKQLLNFIQIHLQKSKDWLLIFDNVVTLNNIADLLPHDVKVWGSGKIIITTNNSNIKQSNLIHPNHCIHIEELSLKDSLELFCTILYSSSFALLPKQHQEEIKYFITKIPNFPLDISLAAYYVKQTNANFNQYLKNIYLGENHLTKVREQIISDHTLYSLSRQKLLENSFNQILLIDEKFKDILFFVSLFNFKDIPKSLLKFYFDEDTINYFILTLKKYSLLTEEHSANKSKNSNFISFHPYIQSYGRLYFETKLEEKELHKLINQSIAAIKKCFDSLPPYQYDIFYIQCRQHLNSFLEYIENSSHTEAIQTLHYLLGKICFIGTRELQLAKKHFEKVLSYDNILSLSKLEQINLYKDLADICKDMEDAKNTLYYAQKALNLIEKETCSSDLTYIKAQLYLIRCFANLFLDNISLANEDCNQALSLIKSDKSKKFTDFRSYIRSHQAWIHAVTYLTKPEGECAGVYANEALQMLKADISAKGKVSRFVIYLYITNGDILCRQGKFQEALTENFAKVQKYFDKKLTHSPHIISRVYLDIDFGECWLRTGKLDKATAILENVIKRVKALLGNNTLLVFYPSVFLMECYLRLGKLELAREQVNVLMEHDICSHTKHTQFIEGLFHYNAVCLYTKKGESINAEKHLKLFIDIMNKFLKFFYSAEEYQNFQQNTVPALTTNNNDIHAKLKICKTILNSVYKDIDFFEL